MNKSKQKQTSISSFFKRPVKTVEAKNDVADVSSDASSRVSRGSKNMVADQIDSAEDSLTKEPTSRGVKRSAPTRKSDSDNHIITNKRIKASESQNSNHVQSRSVDPIRTKPASASLQNGGKSNPRSKLLAYQFTKSKNIKKEPLSQEQQELHDLFLAKLGKPGSLEKIRQRLRQNGPDANATPGETSGDSTSSTAIGEDTDNSEVGADGNDSSAQDHDVNSSDSSAISLGRFASGVGTATKSGTTCSTGHVKLTPMDEQYVALKKDYPDAIILVEVGYKYKIYGYDAVLAAKAFGWNAVPGKLSIDNSHPTDHLYKTFASTSFPIQALDRRVRNLVDKGFKVGVVQQMETAAIKSAGSNKSKLMKRELTFMHTKGTFLEEFQHQSQGQFSSLSMSGGYILCVCTGEKKTPLSPLSFGLVAVRASTGDIIVDEFIDTPLLTEFETRLLHIQPCEVLIVGEVPTSVDTMIKRLSIRGTQHAADSAIRVESRPKLQEAEASSLINNFYARNESVLPPTVLTSLSSLSLASLIGYLETFKLQDVLYLTNNFTTFTSRNHMLLNANTLTSLEIFQNETNFSEKGSLFWILDHTRTPFGQRLLKSWLAKPLVDREQLELRVEAVSELVSSYPDKIHKIAQIMKRLPDMEKGLIRLYYKRTTRKQLYFTLDFLREISVAFSELNPEKVGFGSKVLNELFALLPKCREIVIQALSHISPAAAKEDRKEDFFKDDDFEEYENITDQKLLIADIDKKLSDHLELLRKQLDMPKLEYKSIQLTNYLVLIPKSKAKTVPKDWIRGGSTKDAHGYHTPEVRKLLKEKEYHREKLSLECDSALSLFLDDLVHHYEQFREVISAVSQIDCLMSLAAASSNSNYTRVQYVDTPYIQIKDGRHPMVDQLLSSGSFVPNSVDMSHDVNRSLIITGPNMGGKSSYVRQVALICIMAQIGCFVPAESATLGIVDAIYTRMGAYDNMLAGESTFMVELKECVDIINNATERSLVILDEIGRGTGTMDGVGIAHAVLSHFITDIKSLTLFVTHYPLLAEFENEYPGIVSNHHMGFLERDGEFGKEITFLFTLETGIAHRSYGLNVARLAGVPSSILHLARIKSEELEKRLIARRSMKQAIKDAIQLKRALVTT
ncbi:mismatch repair protein MSH3 [Sugiyamaella lignohabitans]|uniref:DNA mismatch repair protein n=1 Tax=Sugiyamaella lignohabitans TaxID=796027 RepID=A0A167EK33_9ASCO|nr:mismatch repair protein MSH3 [Sugiyamaella lignohabitans]ANB14169.1 mismatch repair protein MSH3 [Sugiyamaella lignohabitans]